MENEEHPPRESGPKQKIQLRLPWNEERTRHISHPKIHGWLLNGELRSADERTLRSTTSTRGWLGSREKRSNGSLDSSDRRERNERR